MAEIPLGKTSRYPSAYAPELLFSVPRNEKWGELGLSEPLPFGGVDCWTAFELSWLNTKGKPQVAIGQFIFPADSRYLVESKSLKLYLNSLNQEPFASVDDVQQRIAADLEKACGKPVRIEIFTPTQFGKFAVREWEGLCIDDIDTGIDDFEYNPNLLKLAGSGEETRETLISHLLKSNCLITTQPDWASVLIRYQGPKIDHESLLKYLISFRNHNEFHEQCVERIFCDLKRYCRPSKLTVYARYTRRGGLDINPFRSDFEAFEPGIRLARQ